MQIRYYYYLDLPHLLLLLFIYRRYEAVYYFDISSFASFTINLTGMRNKIKPVLFAFSDTKDNEGRNCYPKIYGKDAIGICDDIEKLFLKKSILVEGMGKIFDKRKILLFYKKIIYKNITDFLIYINVISQNHRELRKNKILAIEFVVNEEIFHDVLKEFALKEHGVILYSTFNSKKFTEYLTFLLRNLYQLIADCTRSVRTSISVCRKAVHVNDRKASLVGHLYLLKGITFNLLDRCDFPWFFETDIPRKNLLVYFEREDYPVTDNIANELGRRNIRCMAMSKGASASRSVSVYQPSIGVAKQIFLLLSKLILFLVKNCLRGGLKSLVYLPEAIHFIKTYARAYDFYSLYNIKINLDYVDFDPYRIARHAALKDTGGISVSYQVSDWPISQTTLGSAADTMFLFGPYYYQMFLMNGSCNASIVMMGYISDYSFSHIKMRSCLLRKSLQDKGARFIISYFDENSSNDRKGIIPHERSAHIYNELFKWVLQDSTLGLICSPKVPNKLLIRLPQIKELMQQVKETGRCIFTTGEYLTNNYPSEVAQASDITITLLIGRTVALESALSGSKVVHLDLEQLYSYPEYIVGRNRIVFDSMENLFSAIERYRKDPKSLPGFGDLSELIKDKDPFKDGKAALRMGQYIGWLFEKLKNEESRDKALQYANSKYAEMWGKVNIHSSQGNPGSIETEHLCLVK